ncbi:autotransporter outer membrane beta-barrel domain-containing protein, partial [Campylobacter sp. MG1]|uniref:autotransporter outer membrane beta-barrel domain-containing protein n=1 Tax=Campylobacter sp. MG1 TaxID=2976332 RepID=UPI00226C669C
RNNETNKGFWINTDYNYLETNTNNLKANRVYIGVDNKLDFNNFNLVYGIKASKSKLKSNKTLSTNIDVNSIGIYAGMNFNQGTFIDYDLNFLALKSNYKSDIALIDTTRYDNIWQAKIKLGQRIGSNYYLEPNIKLIATYYPSININNQALDISTKKDIQYTTKVGIKAGANINDKLSLKTEASYIKDLNNSPINSVSDGIDYNFERIKDSGLEIKFRIDYKPSPNTSIGLDLTKSITKHFNNNYNVNLGFAYNF